MRVYVACPWKHKHAAVATAQLLRAEGHEVTSRWHDNQETKEFKDPAGTDAPEAVCRREAYNDISDVQHADVVLVMNIELSEGKAVEQGLAIAFGIPIIVVGPRSNVFQYIDSVHLARTYSDAIRLLSSWPVPTVSVQSAPSGSISACDR